MKANAKDSPICVVAGLGELPELIINQLKESNRDFIVVLIEGQLYHRSAYLSEHELIKLSKIGAAIDLLKKRNVKQIAFAGKIERPDIASIKFDITTLSILGKLGISKLSGGDDNILRIVRDTLNKSGIEIAPIESIIPDLLTPRGCLTKKKSSPKDKVSRDIGVQILQSLGHLDVGQSVVIEDKYVLGIEAAEGTDMLIERCGRLRKSSKSSSGVLVKMKKTNQLMSIDLPAFGRNTVQNVYNSGLNGIYVQAGASIIINKPEVVKLANELGIFIEGILI